MKKVSVIVPVFNSEKYLSRLCLSLTLQNYENIEYIFVDDGSTDGSARLIREFQKQIPNLCYIYQKNAGTSAARNRGLKAATGDLITFIDSDDYVLPYFFSKMVARLEETDADIVLCGVICEENGVETLREHEDFDVVKSQTDFLRDIFLKVKATYIVCNKIFKREIIGTDAFIPGYMFEDMYVSYTTALKAKKIAYISEDLYVYCIHSSSVYTTDSNKQFTDFAYLADLIIKLCIKEEIASLLKKEMLLFLENGIIRMERVYARSDKRCVSEDVMKHSIMSMRQLQDQVNVIKENRS